MNLDVLAVQEVEDIDTLRQFVRDDLAALYPHVVLIEGNDPRLIEIGLRAAGRQTDRRLHRTPHTKVGGDHNPCSVLLGDGALADNRAAGLAGARAPDFGQPRAGTFFMDIRLIAEWLVVTSAPVRAM
jgi:hypothetical protein